MFEWLGWKTVIIIVTVVVGLLSVATVSVLWFLYDDYKSPLCPKCGHKMKYQNQTLDLKGKSKRCVYCGRSFTVVKAIVKKL